ncbi:MAG: penicillin-binding transpeptidase domain-containing protein [Clostridium fessum]
MALSIPRNVLAYDENEVNLLRVSGEEYAYQFLMNKIRNIEITPAQLALDPCTASCVVTSAKTGEVLALVSYPSYDNNRISDSTYFAQLNADQSLPLRNNATQTLKATKYFHLQADHGDCRSGRGGNHAF